MYPNSDAEAVWQVVAAAKVEMVDIKKVCIHMHGTVAMWMCRHSVL